MYRPPHTQVFQLTSFIDYFSTTLAQFDASNDNIIYNKQRHLIFAGILENQISDHQAILINTTHRPPPCKSKYITLYSNSDASKEKFRTYINSLNLYAILDTNIDSDPSINYEIIESAITNAMDIHLAEKVVKFNSRKHKKRTLDDLWYSKFYKSEKQVI